MHLASLGSTPLVVPCSIPTALPHKVFSSSKYYEDLRMEILGCAMALYYSEEDFCRLNTGTANGVVSFSSLFSLSDLLFIKYNIPLVYHFLDSCSLVLVSCSWP